MKHLIKTLTILSLFSACGKVDPQVDEQPERKMALPNFNKQPDGIALANVDNQQKFEYSGSTLLWNENVKPEIVKEIARTSNETKLLWAAHHKLWVEQILPSQAQIKKVKQELDDLKEAANKDKDSRNKEFDKLQEEMLKVEFHNWFIGNLEQVRNSNGALLNSLDKELILRKFQIYCEGKLLQFASNMIMMNFKYLSRPTPSAICESFYRNPVNYLQKSADTFVHSYKPQTLLDTNTEECSDATSNAGKDYFRCFWTQGVLKTIIWNVQYNINPQQSGIDDSTYIEFNKKLLGALADESKKSDVLTMAGKLYDKVLNKLTFENVIIAPKKISIPVLGIKNPKKQVETSEVLDASLLNEDQNLFFVKESKDSELVTKMRQFINILSLGGDFSANDSFHNFPKMTNELKLPQAVNTDLNKNGNIARSLYPNIFLEKDAALNVFTPEYQSKIDSLDKQIAPLDKKLKVLEKQSEDLGNVKFNTLSQESLKAVHSPNSVHALWGTSRLEVLDLKTVYQVKYAFSDRTTGLKWYVGCAAKDSGKPVDCPNKTRDELSIPAKVSFEKESGKFEMIATLIDDPSTDMMIGVATKKDQSEFNNLPIEDLKNRQLTIKAYPAMVGKVIPYMTGDFNISGGGKPEIKGTINLSGYTFFKKQIGIP